MPDEGSPRYEAWKDRIGKEFAALNGEVIVVGHSLGASVLLKYVTEEEPAKPVAGMFLIAPPFWGAPNWEAREFAACEDFARRLSGIERIFLYHSRDDEVVPFAHLAMYAQHLPQAAVRELDGCGHQLAGDLSEVAHDIKSL
ncbi:alpha/beta hydrolase [Paenibacillus hamazuiensis]|uniref:alpha/beta hydrolase n=1 Tax=Paenibacillus hamazuiensis TaxID=2936508 RepID=UPI00200D5405|nr:alpha/beta hydrolase [Paenibacillus hamazuiensis]